MRISESRYDSADDAVRPYPTDAMIGVVGDVEAPIGPQGKPLSIPDLGSGRRSAIAADARWEHAVARDGSDDGPQLLCMASLSGAKIEHLTERIVGVMDIERPASHTRGASIPRANTAQSGALSWHRRATP